MKVKDEGEQLLFLHLHRKIRRRFSISDGNATILSKCTLLYRGNDALKITENCHALPVEQFLRDLTPNAPLPTH